MCVLIEDVPHSGKRTLIQQMCPDRSISCFVKDYERIIQVILMSLPKDQALSLEDLIYTSAGGEGVAKEVADFVITYQQ